MSNFAIKSLSNLGNSLSGVKKILEIFNAVNGQTDFILLDAAGDAMRKIFDGLDTDSAIKAFKKIGVEGDDLRNILNTCCVSTEKIDEAMKKTGKSGTGFIGKLKTGFEGLAATIGLSTAQLGWLIAALAIPAAVVAGWKIYSNYINECVQNAKSAGDAWSSSNTSLEGQLSRLREINSALEQGNLTEEESYALKSELYSIQQSLVGSYGKQADNIDLVNGKLSEEIALVEQLNAANANQFLNENITGINKATKEMEKSRTMLLGSFYDFGTSDAEAINNVIEKYGEYLSIIDGEDGYTKQIYFEGDATQAKEVLNNFATDLRDVTKEYKNSGLADALIEGTSKQLGDVSGILDEYQELYEQARKATLITDTNEYTFGDKKKTAIGWISEYEDAVNKYNEALKSGDMSKIEEASSVFEDSAAAISALAEGGLADYSREIEEITSRLNTAAIAAIDFREALSGDDSAIGRSIDQYAEQLKNIDITDVELKSALDIDGLQRGEAAFRELVNAAYDCGLITGKTSKDVQPLIDILVELGVVAGDVAASVAEATEEVTASYSSMTEAVTSMKSELSAINGAISEQGYSGNLSVDTYNSLIAISKDYAACIEYQNGALQLNAEKANMLFEAKNELKIAEIELQKIAEATKWKENSDEIARLSKEYDGLDNAIKDQIDTLRDENAGIERNLIGYDLQIAALEELTSAYGRWKAVSESDNSDSMYKEIQNAYKAIKEAQKTGQTGVGNVVYQAAVELLVPDGEDVKKYMGTLKRYITDGSSGLTNFINDMVSKGLMERSKSDWNQVSMVAGTTMQEILDKMTLTPEMAKAIFNALEMYDFDFDWTDEDFNINTDDAMAELKAAQEEMNNTIAKINEMKEAGATVDLTTGMSLEDLEKKYAEQKSQVDKLMSSATGTTGENAVEYTVTANTSAAEDALGTISEKLDEIAEKIANIAEMVIGTLGAGATKTMLDRVYGRLIDIANFHIPDKTFNVIASLKNGSSSNTSGSKQGGSLIAGNNVFGSLLPSDIGFFASGTKNAPDGTALVGDEYSPDGSPKPELVITNGSAYVAGQHGPELVDLKQGDQVIPAAQTKRILHGNPQVRKNTIPAFASGTSLWDKAKNAVSNAVSTVVNAVKNITNSEVYKAASSYQTTGTVTTLDAPKKTATSSTTSSSTTKANTTVTSSTNKGVNLGTGVSMPTTSLSSTYKTYDPGPKSYESTVPGKSTSNVTISGNGNSGSLHNYGGSGGGSGGSSGSGSSDSASSVKEKSQFEKDYEYHQHLLAMEKEDYEAYINWLESAYKDAYAKGQIELEDFYRFEEEVYSGRKELFQDSIADIEHKIKGLERDPGNEQQIINYYNQIIQKIDAELAAARARGLSDDDEYIQELVEQKWDYADEIKDIQDEITENAKDAVEDLIDYRIDMLKQDIENEKDAANDKLDTLKDFYDKQKEMLQDVYDEEKYLEEQSEKRKSVSDIRAEIDMLKFDDSAKAAKRRKELEEELKEAEKELADFEKDHAFENATDLLDKMYEQQEKQIQSEIDALDERLNDPEALYNKALRDIQNNTLALYEEMVKYNAKYGSGNSADVYDMWTEADKSLDAYFKAMGQAYKDIILVDAYKPTGYASGASRATPGIHELFEGNKDEYVYTTKDGRKYRMFSGLGEKVLNASATDFPYKFANNGETFISNMLNGLVGAIGNVSKPAQSIQLSTGDVIVQGNASAETVSAIRRAQRENIDFVLREFTRLNR